MNNSTSSSLATEKQQNSPNRSGLQLSSSNEAPVTIDGPSQQGPGSAENGQHVPGVRTQPETTKRVSKILPSNRSGSERQQGNTKIHTRSTVHPTEEAQATQQENQPQRRERRPPKPDEIIYDDGIRIRRGRSGGNAYPKEPPYAPRFDDYKSDWSPDSSDSVKVEIAGRRSRKGPSNIQSQPRGQPLPKNMTAAQFRDRVRNARTDIPAFYDESLNEREDFSDEPAFNPRYWRSDRENSDSRMPPIPPERERTYIPRQGPPDPKDLYNGFSSGKSAPSPREFISSQNYPPETGRQDFSSGGPGGGGFSFSNSESIFSEILRGQVGTGGGDEFEDLFGGSQKDKQKSRSRRPSPPPVTTVERPILLSLEELFHGAHKKVKFRRKMFDEVTGRLTLQDKILEMDIKPGLKKGSRIKFKGVGDQEEASQQDLHFVVEEKPHPIFSRDGNDIHHTLTLDLRELICGWERIVTTIDNKQIKIEKVGPTPPGSSDTYPDLGMPLSKKPHTRGDFIVFYQVKYPTVLTLKQKDMISDVLS